MHWDDTTRVVLLAVYLWPYYGPTVMEMKRKIAENL